MQEKGVETLNGVKRDTKTEEGGGTKGTSVRVGARKSRAG